MHPGDDRVSHLSSALGTLVCGDAEAGGKVLSYGHTYSRAEGAWKATRGQIQRQYQDAIHAIFRELTETFDADHTLREAPESDLPPSYGESFARLSADLASLGFLYLGSYEDLTLKRIHPENVPVFGVFAGEGGAVIAETMGIAGRRVVSFTTELDDGRVATTNNTGLDVFRYPPAFQVKTLPGETPTGQVLAFHRSRLAADAYSAAAPLRYGSIGEVMEADARRFRTFRLFRISLGYLTRPELDTMMVRKDLRDQVLEPLWGELHARLEAHRLALGGTSMPTEPPP